MGTIAVTGSASGIGAAVAAHLEKEGHRVIGVDLRDTEVTADLATAEGRAHAVAEVTRISEGRLDGFLPFAGVAAATGRPGRPIGVMARNCFIPSPVSASLLPSWVIGVSMMPGAMALRRMPSAMYSADLVRAYQARAAFVAG